MGHWVEYRDKLGIKGIFWSSYFMGLFFNMLAFLGTGSVKYYDKNKNNSKIIGVLLGLCPSFVLYGTISFIANGAWKKLIIICAIGIPLSILITILVYKKVIVPWINEDRKKAVIELLLQLKLSREANHITEEEYLEIKEAFKQYLEKLSVPTKKQ